jgi:Mg/Co/Ni transporter MgtE
MGTALKIMEQKQLHRLPVVDRDDHLIGMLSLADAAREAMREHDRARKEMTDTQIGAVLEAISMPRSSREVAVAA